MKRRRNSGRSYDYSVAVLGILSADAAGLILFKFHNENISEEAHEIIFFCTVYKGLELNLRYKTTENM